MANLKSLSTGERIQTGGGGKKKQQLKNAYTILEKVRKGEIQSGYYDNKGGMGLFDKLAFYKKPDLVKPHLHYLDDWRVETVVDNYIKNDKNIKTYYERVIKSNVIDKSKKPDFDQFSKDLKDRYAKFPKHMKNDIFKLYYNNMERIDFEPRTDKNNLKFKFLENSNNPVGKIMSEGSNMKSSIFTRNAMLNYMVQMTTLQYIDEDASKQLDKGMSGEGDGEGNDEFDKFMNSEFGKSMQEQAMDDAMKECKTADDVLDKELQEKMFEDVKKGGTSDGAGDFSPEYIRKISAKLENVKLSMGSLKESIKKLMDKSTSYFSARKETIYEDLFNADNIAGLDEYEMLHPRLRKIMIEDIVIKDTKSIGKIDVYVDISGSMDSSCNANNTNGARISKLDFAKAMIAKLADIDMLSDVYIFNNRCVKYRNDKISIAMLDTNGGTTINEAMRMLVKNNKNALVITDAEDGCGIYSDKAFFIGVEGASFNHFNKGVLEQYHDGNQMVVFDGHKIHKVNKKGYQI